MVFKTLPSRIKNRYKLLKYIKPFVKEHIRPEFKISKQNSIAIFAHPRGGSTWLAEILKNIENSILIDEPLWRGSMLSTNSLPNDDHRKVPEAAHLKFYYNQPIPVDDEWPEAREMFEQIIKCQIPSLGLYEENDLKKLKNGKIHLVKFCYGHLLMEWFIKNFDVNSILLVRHPCAVVASQLTSPYWKNISVSIPWVIQDFKYNEIYKAQQKLFEKANTIEKYLAASWAFSLRNLLGNPQNNIKWITISYERLISNYREELERLFSRLKMKLPPRAYEKFNVSSRSVLDHDQKYIDTSTQLTKWRDLLSRQQIDQILGMVEDFGIEGYSVNPEPDYKKIYNQI